MTNKGIFKALPAMALLLTGTTATAQEDAPDTWKLGAEVYFWGASMGGTTSAGQDIEVGIDDLLDNLKMGGMGTLAARKGRWSMFGDLIYLDDGDSGNTTVSIGPRGRVQVPASASLDLKAVISTVGAGYRFYDASGTTLDAVGGVRMLWLDTTVKASVGSVNSMVKDSGSNFDAIIGLRGQSDLNEKWYVDYYADIGTGQSDFTWQAAVGINYRLEKADLSLGYRYMSWDLGGSQPISDLNLSGVYAGVKFAF